MVITAQERPSSPVDVVRHMLRLFEMKEIHKFIDMWAEDGSAIRPFAIPGADGEVIGRETLRSYVKNYGETMDVRKVVVVRIHQTTDPAVVIAEWIARGITVKTGRPYEMRYITVIEVRHGEVVSYIDYFSPILAARAAGDNPDLIAMFSDEDFEESFSTEM